ncbi:hypothetical protein [Flavobacterium sp. PL002]|uniref:hypothetical protein n=1 Tax=Flavobacterium sp. PL002 TaxID=1897058 RepID=UPI00178783A7|nr:hypothetical protein [Flavobacterium sp. PL002]MBE0391534.1 hypothetical protein [Flavobacterium sp. PL002]
MPKEGVFIIESLTLEDEKQNRYEGKFISQILNLGGISSEYYYIRTLKEFIKIIEKFKESEYRYLHISCHGTSASIETTIDSINFEEFGKIVGPNLKNKRLFISACSAVNRKLANQIFPFYHCYSLMGFDKDIYFNDAAITWASLYHLIIPIDKMKTDYISETTKKLSELYKVPINFFKQNRMLKSQYNLKQFKI